MNWYLIAKKILGGLVGEKSVTIETNWFKKMVGLRTLGITVRCAESIVQFFVAITHSRPTGI